MSLIVSPKTGRLIKVGSDEFSELLADPKYRDQFFEPNREKLTGKVEPITNFSPLPNPSHPSPLYKLPPLPKLKTPSKLPTPPNSPFRNKSPSNSLKNVKMPFALPPAPLPVVDFSPVKIPLKKGKEDSHLDEILKMPFFDIPTLEETLQKTKQPAKRQKISKMISEMKYQEARGMKTRGWSARAPTRGRERHQLKAECGDKCFLSPENEKFPICPSPRITGGKSRCEIDCQGAQSALIRAAQWGYPEVERKANAILEKCNREGYKHFTPSPKKKEYPEITPSLKMAGKMGDDDCGCGGL